MNNGRPPVIGFSSNSDNEDLDAFHVSSAELNHQAQDGTDHFAGLNSITQAFNNLTSREPGNANSGNLQFRSQPFTSEQLFHVFSAFRGIEQPRNQPLTAAQLTNAFQQQQVAMEFFRACQMELLTKDHLKELEERAGAAALMMQSASTPALWNGQITPRVHHDPVYSCKLFIGGIPYDFSERLLYDAFARYGRCRIEWPSRGRTRGVLPREKTVGYVYVVFDEETSAKQLLQDCQRSNKETQDLYFTLNIPSASGGNTRQVQVIPWVVSDANYVHDPAGKLDPKKTIFVGGLHGRLTAETLFIIMSQTFGDVIYVGIDTDKYKYPIGSGRVTFSSYVAFFQAVGSAHLAIQTNKFFKRIQIDPFLEEALCMMCKKVNGQVFCARRQCFSYFCFNCWRLRHGLCSQMTDHKALTRHTAREASPFDTLRWLSLEQMTAAMHGMARSSENPQRSISGHPLGFGTAPSLATGMGGVDLQPYLNLQRQTPPQIVTANPLFAVSGSRSTPSTPFLNANETETFSFPPPPRFA